MRVLLSVLLILWLVPPWTGAARLPLLPDRAEMAAHPVDLDWRNPARKRLGRLTYLGGVRLTGPKAAFGGFSAMRVEGDRFTLLSDGGGIVRFRLDSRWRVHDARFGQLPDGPGRGWQKEDRDSESLAYDPMTGQLWVGFEHWNQIWRYSAGFGRAERHAAPPSMARWNKSSGPESMVRLRDGSFIVLAERHPKGSSYPAPGLWFAGDPVREPRRAFRFGYRAPKGYRPTDIAELPDGRLIVVNRRASLRSGFTAILTVVDRASVRPGRVAAGEEIARFEAPVVHDNFEALAVSQEGDSTILWIASDDNQFFLQRSLLLKFRLDP